MGWWVREQQGALPVHRGWATPPDECPHIAPRPLTATRHDEPSIRLFVTDFPIMTMAISACHLHSPRSQRALAHAMMSHPTYLQPCCAALAPPGTIPNKQPSS